MLPLAVTLGVAQAQTNAEREGPVLTVVESIIGESVHFTTNTALAIDETGTAALAYREIASDNRQYVAGFPKNGDRFDYALPVLPSGLGDSPALVSQPGERFQLTGFELDSDFDPTLVTRVLEVERSQSSDFKGNAPLFNWREISPAPLVLDFKTNANCQPTELAFTPLASGYDNGGALDSEQPLRTANYSLAYCQSGRNYLARVDFNADPPSTQYQLLSRPPNNTDNNTPDSSLRVLAMATTSSGVKAVYAARQTPQSPHRVAVVSVSGDAQSIEIGDSMLLQDYTLIASSGPNIAACGHDQGADHFWVAFTTSQLQAVVARIEGDTVTYEEYGQSNGPIDIACDDWGNALAAWWSDGSDSSIQTAAISANGDLIRRFSEDLAGPNFSVTVSTALNSAGEGVAVWSVDSAVISMQRYTVTGHYQIDGTLSGSHFSPGFNGEGFTFDIAPGNDGPILVLYYFTYQPDGSGEMAWLVGSSPITSNRIEVDVASGTGATFGPDYHPGDVTLTVEGTVTVTYLSCRLIMVETQGDRFGQHRYLAQRLTNPPLEIDGQCGEGPPGTLDIDASWGGSMYSPERNGEGFYFDIVRVDGVPTVVVYYFTYLPDGSGKPAWLVGSGEIIGRSASVPVAFGTGATFGPDFDPTDVTFVPWGTLNITWVSCSEAVVEYEGLWGAGSTTVTPLTNILIGNSGLCIDIE